MHCLAFDPEAKLWIWGKGDNDELLQFHTFVDIKFTFLTELSVQLSVPFPRGI